MTTTDLAKFGYREKAIAAKLLQAMQDQGLPNDFEDNEVTVMMNQNSGYVFLTNSEYQVCMLNGDNLESFYTTPYDGKEGYFEELMEEYDDMHKEDKAYMRDIKRNRSK